MRSTALAWYILVVIVLAALSGCTVAAKDGFFYGNVGFEKAIVKAEIGPDGSVRIEGVKNTTPQIVEAAVRAGVEAAK